MLADDLKRLTHRYTVTIDRVPSREGREWNVMLIGEQGWEEPDATFEGSDLAKVVAIAREWDETPLADQLPADQWLRLYQAAAHRGIPVQELVQRGVRELLDRLDGAS